MLIYGKNVVLETLKNKEKIKKVYMYRNFNDEEIINILNKEKINITLKEKYEMDKLVNGMHQGIILEVEDYKYEDIDNLNGDFLVMLDHLEDPHNFGAIIRTCEAAKVDGIIIPKDRSVSVNSTVVKVSTGAIKNVKISEVTNLNNTISKLKEKGYWIIGTDIKGTNYYDIDYKGKIAIIIGNEGSGMSRLVKENSDFIASIPMKGTTNSLNASVAAGIVIFEALKQRG